MTEEPTKGLVGLGKNVIRTGSSRLLGVVLIVTSAILFLVASVTGFLPFELASLVSFVLGVALLVVELEPRVKISLTTDSMLGYLRSLDGAMDSMNATGKATYVPKGDAVKMVMPRFGTISTMELPPVGAGLYAKMTDELGDLSQKGQDFYEIWVPRVVVDNLSMADDVKISRKGEGIQVSMNKPFVRLLCIDPFVNEKVCCRMGCPLASALAQALASSTGKDVRFDDCTYDPKTQQAKTSLSFA